MLVAQVAASPLPPLEQQYIVENQQIRPLPGQLNDVLVFNSNSPEVIQTEGILLSTFPPNGKTFPNAHLERALSGRFDIFTHHISRPLPGEKRTLYQGLLLHNPTSKTVLVKVLQAASYLTSPDAPFVDLPSIVEDPSGEYYSGPGSRLVGDILRGVNKSQFPKVIAVPPQQSRMLFSLPINTSSARSTFVRVESDGPLYVANLALYSIAEFPKVLPTEEEKDTLTPPSPTSFRPPKLDEWRYLLVTGRLATPRDLPPTPLSNNMTEKPVYGRVAGISVGSEWVAQIADKPGNSQLSIPESGQAFSYPLSTVNVGTYATKQVQSAPMLVRYPDTAFRAHGNYGVHYSLTLPLVNNTDSKKSVTVALQTPFKQDQYADRLIFAKPVQGQVFFRGPVRVTYEDEKGDKKVRYFHLIQRQGQQGDALVMLNMLPGDRREVNIDFLYPPDATPPQVITVRTLDWYYGRN
jgi:hypothetical protein